MPTQLGSQIDMAVQPGFENLQPKVVSAIDISRGELSCIGLDGREIPMQLYVTPQGHLLARTIPPVPIDQQGEREPVRRYQGVDQI